VIGGPDVTSSPEAYEAAPFVVRGEAESIIGDFVAAWEAGATEGHFEAERFTADITQSPIPRFDLLNFDDYLYVGVQYSRGCPFSCEFCDIIELFGQVPRTKRTDQMLAELDRLYAMGYRGRVDFVDDNFIGNKKALKLFLPELCIWQKERDFPFQFSTEASINLADHPDLLALMREANFYVIFVGIESPETDVLVATQKKQNTRRDLAESVHKIYGAGMYVIAGFIVGFDAEKSSVAQAMVDCIEATGIPVCMTGLLAALPETQLARRLSKEGRLLPFTQDTDRGDQCTGGLNFVTLRQRSEVLNDLKVILETVYRPSAYFGRVRRVARVLRPQPAIAAAAAGQIKTVLVLSRLMTRLVRHHRDFIGPFCAAIFDCLKHNVAALDYVITMTAFYLHLGPFSKKVIAELERQIFVAEAERPRPGHDAVLLADARMPA
jgi:radical SAM superfamily enzyme YgiQ (UPF0313 family)